MRNVILVGFMGAGKTAIGEELAKQTGRRFMDTDRLIEQRERLTVSEIFKRFGEPYFRNVERLVVSEVVKETGCVIATGGGAVLDEKNLRALKESGTMVYLKADPEALSRRIRKGRPRPLLQTPDPQIEIRRLMKIREPYYAQADIQIDTSRYSPAEVVRLVRAQIERRNGEG
jgi:shikimate kinase